MGKECEKFEDRAFKAVIELNEDYSGGARANLTGALRRVRCARATRKRPCEDTVRWLFGSLRGKQQARIC